MIFCVLTNTPCVAFDNNNHKISQTAEWLKGNKRFMVIKSVEDLSSAIKIVTSHSDEVNLDNSYLPLINIITKNGEN